MRTSAVILQLLSLWSLLDRAVQRTLAADQEDVPPLVLPEVKALPAYSFRGPIPEGGKINGFEISGQATRLPTSPDFLRISPPIPLSNGAVFSTSTVKSKEWVVEIALRVHGSARASSSKGGRGWAFWYTKSSSPTKGQQPAAQTHSSHDNKVSFFGQNINFDGLGIVFDSAPSAPLLPRSDPAGWAFGADSTGVISAVIDDGKTGTKWFDEDYKAGERRYPGQEAKYLEKVVGECEAAFRNAPGLVWVRIAYFNKQIRVDLDLQPHTTLTPEKRHFTHHCFTVQDISLPSGYYFGITSLSSGNTDPDSVDVYAFDAWEVTGKADGQAHEQPAIPELEKKTGTANFRPLAGTEEVVQDLQHEGGTHPGHGGVSSVQDVIAAQLRMTEAIDALARRVDALHARLDGGSGSAGGSGNLEKQLQEISASVSRLTGQHPSQKGKDGGALTAEELEQQSVQYLVKMITRLSSDVNGITVRLDSLTTRVNKNIATIMNRVGEVFTLASRSEKLLFEKYGASTTSKNAALGLGLSIGGITFTIVKWLGGLGACLFLLVLGDRWRRGRLSSGGGRGRKMI